MTGSNTRDTGRRKEYDARRTFTAIELLRSKLGRHRADELVAALHAAAGRTRRAPAGSSSKDTGAGHAPDSTTGCS